MKFYQIDPDTGEKELVGATEAIPFPAEDFHWAMDPRAIRLNDWIYDENGKKYALHEVIKS